MEQEIPKEKEQKKKLREEIEKRLQNQKKFIKISSVISIIGFIAVGIFVVRLTGAAIGATRENYTGLFVLLVFSLLWTVIGLISVLKEKKGINIKELIEEGKKYEQV